MNDHTSAHQASNDPVAEDIANRDPQTGDALDGDYEGERPVAPHPDDLRRESRDGEGSRDTGKASSQTERDTEEGPA